MQPFAQFIFSSTKSFPLQLYSKTIFPSQESTKLLISPSFDKLTSPFCAVFEPPSISTHTSSSFFPSSTKSLHFPSAQISKQALLFSSIIESEQEYSTKTFPSTQSFSFLNASKSLYPTTNPDSVSMHKSFFSPIPEPNKYSFNSFLSSRSIIPSLFTSAFTSHLTSDFLVKRFSISSKSDLSIKPSPLTSPK